MNISSSEQILSCGQLSLNKALKKVEYNGQSLNLSPNSFELLAHLMQQSPAVVSVDELLAEVWHNKVVNRETVKQQIKALRDQLGAAASLVTSVRGFGYQIKPPEDTTVAAEQDLARDFRLYRIRWVVVLVVAVIGVLFWLGYAGKNSSIQLPLKTATLPFKLLDSTDQDLVWLLQEELTNMLSRQADVRAISISAVEHAKYQNYSSAEYAEQLDVDMLFEGSIQESETGYEVSVRMVWTKNSVAVWRDNITIAGKDRQQVVSQTRDTLRDFINKKVTYIKSKSH